MTDCAPVTILIGLTASGKKTVGIRIVEMIKGEALSLDSMKIYRGLDIGTAKPSREDRARVPIHLLDLVDPDESFSVGQFLAAARQVLSDLKTKKCPALFLGGTAFYLNCLVNGLIEGFGNDPEVRRQLIARADEQGSPALHQELARQDPSSAESIHPNDRKRIIRALEVIEISGHTLSWLKENRTRKILDQPPVIAGLRWPEEELKTRIEERTRKMVQYGLLEEVRTVLENKGFGPESGKAIGYKQIIAHLHGKTTLEQATQEIITATWRFAKKQMTWYKRFPEIRWFPVNSRSDPEKVAAEIKEYYLGAGAG